MLCAKIKLFSQWPYLCCVCRASKADLKIVVVDASTFLPAKPSHVSWARFVHSHMTSLGVGESSDLTWDEQEQLEGGSLPHFPSAATRTGAGLAVHAAGCQHDDVKMSHSHTATDGLNSKSSASNTKNLFVATLMDKPRVHTSEAENDSRMYISANMNDSRLLNSKNMKESKMADSDDVPDLEVRISDDVIVVVNKSDLVSAEIGSLLLTSEELGVDVCHLSCVTTVGLNSFVSLLAERVKRL